MVKLGTVCTGILLFLFAGGCAEKEWNDERLLRFDVVHPAQSRVTATAFESGDRVGIYMRKQEYPWEVSGNFVNNEPIVYENDTWTTGKLIFWEEGVFDVVGYYPYLEEMNNVTDIPFSVALDQSTEGEGEELGGYEASDFLWAGKEGIGMEDGVVRLTFAHRMSRLVVRLVPTEDYEGEIPEDAIVKIHSTVPKATIDLTAGVVTKDPYGAENVIKARKEGERVYTAIVVPQRLDYTVPLLEVVAGGISYIYDMRFVFKSGVQHTVTAYLSRNPEQIKIEIGGDIEGWN